MSSVPPFLQRLDLGLDADESAIRRAYARKLKQIDQEVDPSAFQALREAYEVALRWARNPEIPEARAAADPLPEMPAPVETAVPPSRPAPVDAGVPRDAAARAVFAQLAAGITARSEDFGEVKTAFLAALDDPRLIPIDVKDFFEWCVAEHLAGGWRPGNESLMSLAIQHFDWERDRRRLARFGRVGATLDRAIEEVNDFSKREGPERARQVMLIRGLRSDERPANAMLAGMPVLEWLAKAYPIMFPLITHAPNLERWRAWAAELDNEMRERTRRSTSVPFGAIFLILAVLGLVSLIPGKPRPVPASVTYGFLREDSSVYRTLIGPALDGAPTAKKCEQTARLEQTLGRNAPLGPDFDRRIVECAALNLWPNAADSDPVVRAAIERQQLKK